MREQNSIRKRATLAQVAKLAGVSPSTASSVINGRDVELRIAPATRDRVMSAASQLDYVPNQMVSSLKSGRTNVVSFFNAFRSRVVGDMFMDRLEALLEVEAGNAGYDVLIHTNFKRSPEETYRTLNGGTSDATILFAPFADDPVLNLLRNSNLPTVLIFSFDPLGTLPSVSDDPVDGLRQLAKSFFELGHRNIIPMVETGSSVRDAEVRISALSKALSEYDITLGEPVAVEADRKKLVKDLPELWSASGEPTAIFCWRDFLAYEVLASCNELGWPVPEKFSVVGYDGIHWPAIAAHQVATVVPDLEQLIRTAFTMIDRLVEGKELLTAKVRVKTDFVPGTTLGPARHKLSPSRHL